MSLKYTIALALCLAVSSASHAALMYDKDVTNDVILGDGNGNGEFPQQTYSTAEETAPMSSNLVHP